MHRKYSNWGEAAGFRQSRGSVACELRARREALECVQLAAAFSGGNSLPAMAPWPPRPSPLHGPDGRGRNQPPASWLIRQERQQAGAGKSGSKLHALQSFAPYARSGAENFVDFDAALGEAGTKIGSSVHRPFDHRLSTG